MTGSNSTSNERHAARTRPLVRLLLLLLLFLLCTLLGLWWASPDNVLLQRARNQMMSLAPTTYLVLAGFAVALIGAEVLRYVIMGSALNVRVGFWAALDATVASNFFSWLTPGAALGEPAATYMLGRRGVSWDAAMLIAFGKFVISFGFICSVGFVLVMLGFGPPIPPWFLLPIAWAVGFVALLFFMLTIGAFWPTQTTSILEHMEHKLVSLFGQKRQHGQQEQDGRCVRRIQSAIARIGHTGRQAVHRLSRFRQAGLTLWLAILATQAIYHVIFIGILVLLIGALHPAVIFDAVPIAIIYQVFLYLAPTPGSAGLGEAGAELFFGNLLPDGSAFAVVVTFRTLTYYLHLAIGIIYLPLTGGLREVLVDRRAR